MLDLIKEHIEYAISNYDDAEDPTSNLQAALNLIKDFEASDKEELRLL